jgi:hypothetical protein
MGMRMKIKREGSRCLRLKSGKTSSLNCYTAINLRQMMATSKTFTHLTQVNLFNFLTIRKDKLDLINNLNSIKLLAVSEAFE